MPNPKLGDPRTCHAVVTGTHIAWAHTLYLMNNVSGKIFLKREEMFH